MYTQFKFDCYKTTLGPVPAMKSKLSRPQASHLLTRWCLAWLIFDRENGPDTFLRNVGSYTDYTAIYPRRWQLSRKGTRRVEHQNEPSKLQW
jgi:hypothetical protein